MLIDGRPSILDEVALADASLVAYLAEEVAALMDEPRFIDAVFGFLRPDAASQARAETVVLPRLRSIAAG